VRRCRRRCRGRRVERRSWSRSRCTVGRVRHSFPPLLLSTLTDPLLLAKVASTSVSFVSEERIFRISPLESRIPASRAFPSTLVLLATPVRRARRSRMPIRCLQRLIASKDSTSRREVRVRHPRLRTPQDWSRRHRKRRYNSLLISSRLHRNVRPLFCSLPVPHFLTFALFQATSAPICSAWRTSLPLPSTDLSPVLPTPLKPFAVAGFPFTSLARIVRFLLPLLPTRSANLVLFHSIGGGGGGRLTSGRWRSIELFPGAFSSSCLVISPFVIAHLFPSPQTAARPVSSPMPASRR
jgi:hypothetical protein